MGSSERVGVFSVLNWERRYKRGAVVILLVI